MLVEHPAVVEAGEIGKPSTELEDDIKKFIKKRLAGHAYPREIEFRDSLPKTQELGLSVGDASTLKGV